jgi:hypothetical protein
MKTFLKVLSLLSCVLALFSGDTTAMLVAGATANSDDDQPAKKK